MEKHGKQTSLNELLLKASGQPTSTSGANVVLVPVARDTAKFKGERMKHFLKVANINGDTYYVNPTRLSTITPCTAVEYGDNYVGCCIIREGNWCNSLDRESTALLFKYLEDHPVMSSNANGE